MRIGWRDKTVTTRVPTFSAALDDGLRRRVLARLGFDRPPAADRDGLRALSTRVGAGAKIAATLRREVDP